MSIGDPLCCGFIKCAIFEEQTSTNYLSKQYENIKLLFPEIKLTEGVYRARAKKIKDDIAWLAKKGSDLKRDFVVTFSKENWENLSFPKQQRHGSFECKGCLGDENIEFPFPS